LPWSGRCETAQNLKVISLLIQFFNVISQSNQARNNCDKSAYHTDYRIP